MFNTTLLLSHFEYPSHVLIFLKDFSCVGGYDLKRENMNITMFLKIANHSMKVIYFQLVTITIYDRETYIHCSGTDHFPTSIIHVF
jgi:hypothetical protein